MASTQIKTQKTSDLRSPLCSLLVTSPNLEQPLSCLPPVFVLDIRLRPMNCQYQIVFHLQNEQLHTESYCVCAFVSGFFRSNLWSRVSSKLLLTVVHCSFPLLSITSLGENAIVDVTVPLLMGPRCCEQFGTCRDASLYCGMDAESELTEKSHQRAISMTEASFPTKGDAGSEVRLGRGERA